MKKRSSAHKNTSEYKSGKIVTLDDQFRGVKCSREGCDHTFDWSILDQTSIEDSLRERGWKSTGKCKTQMWWCPGYQCEPEYEAVHQAELIMALKKVLGENSVKLWTIGLPGYTMVGSFTHVSDWDKLYPSQEACQDAINNMRGCIGSPDKSKYRPLPLTLEFKE